MTVRNEVTSCLREQNYVELNGKRRKRTPVSYTHLDVYKRQCDDCPEFDAHVEKEVLFAGYSKKYCNTNITCEHKDKCKRLKDMIEKEAKKRND